VQTDGHSDFSRRSAGLPTYRHTFKRVSLIRVLLEILYQGFARNHQKRTRNENLETIIQKKHKNCYTFPNLLLLRTPAPPGVGLYVSYTRTKFYRNEVPERAVNMGVV
jgi:hypothetical protein